MFICWTWLLLVAYYQLNEKAVGHENGHSVLVVFNSLISLHAEWLLQAQPSPCCRAQCWSASPQMMLQHQRCFQHITSRSSPLCLPSVNEQKCLTDLNTRCYTIHFFFNHKDGCTMCHPLCQKPILNPILISKHWNRGKSDTIIQSQSNCDSTARVALTCSLQEHSTSIISIWFIHQKHKLQFYYAGSHIREFNTVLLETHIWWK